jgi:signal transduction histidine kinase
MVNLLFVSWSIITAACAMLGLIQAFLWWHSRHEAVYPLSMVMAFSAVVISILEINLSSTPEIMQHERLLLWMNLAIAFVLVPMIWAIQSYLPLARRWLATLITVLWAAGMLVNFLLPGNLTFSEVLEVKRYATGWGEEYYLASGTINSWKWLADITVLLIPLYAIDAAWRSRGYRRARQGWIIAAGVALFVIVAGVQAILIDSGLYQAPNAVSLAFLFVVVALTWVLAGDAVRAGRLAEQVAEAQRETERLMRANLMGEVAATLAHELNQPLAAILGNAQAAEKFLQQPETDLDEIREILADIVRDDKRARDIITNLRRMLSGDDTEDQRVDLVQVIREILDFMDYELKKHFIGVQVTTRGNVPKVCGGYVAIQQVVMNLILNARQAILDSNASRRDIRIRLSGIQGGAEIVVRDFGPGIPDDVMQRLFEPFVTTKKGNLGMGLAVCRRIVENQGGRLTAENAEGGGARFRVWLPACTI